MSSHGELTSQLAVCVDFGTACSGYVIKEPYIATTETLDFNAPGEGVSLMKAPSDIAFRVFDKRPQTGSAVIGKKALKRAADEGIDAAHFSRYRMRLYDGTCKVSTKMKVRATNGSEHPLLGIISTALSIIRTEAVKKVESTGHREADIHWIVTVPAMAADEQLAFMRHAAVMAGMVPTPDSPRLTLAAEPEAACAYITMHPMLANMRVGETIAVLDCGGGTHDFVALKLLSRTPFKVEYISEPEGGAGGAADVNEAFYRAISRLVSHGESDTALWDAPDAVVELWKIAEQAKQHLNTAPDESMLFDLGFLADCECVSREDFNACIDAFNEHIGYAALERPHRGMRVRFAARFFYDLVLDAVLPIEELAYNFLTHTSVDHVVAVGGFAESRLLRERLQDVTGTQRLLVPPNPSTCVTRGGIALMGAKVTRICRFTYGVEVRGLTLHKDDSLAIILLRMLQGKLMSDDRFSKCIERGKRISPGWRSAEEKYFPPKNEEDALVFRIFRSAELDPESTRGQEEIGELRVEVDEETHRLQRRDQEHTVWWTWDREIVMIVRREHDDRQWRMCIDLE